MQQTFAVLVTRDFVRLSALNEEEPQRSMFEESRCELVQVISQEYRVRLASKLIKSHSGCFQAILPY